MTTRTLRGSVAVAGIGETGYYKRGQSPDLEFVMALQAVLAHELLHQPRCLVGTMHCCGQRR